jgi:hypothetical protein
VKTLSSETKKTASAISKDKVNYKKAPAKNPWK